MPYLEEVYIMSCNRQLRKDKETPYSNEEFRDLYGNLVPFDIQENCCTDINSSHTIKRMLENHSNKILKDRNKLGENLMYKSLYNIRYSEYRGARMFTCGGIVLDKNDKDLNLNLEDLDYISTVEPYEIEIPNLTYREASYLNQVLNLQDKESDLVQKGIISSEDISKYKKIYRFIPNFYDVRI